MTKDSYHHKDLKNALIDKAVEVLDADPHATISLRGLARDLGVSAMAPYAHFSSKAELLDAVALKGFAHFAKLWVEISEADLSLKERLASYCTAYLNFARTFPGQFDLMFGQALRAKDDAVRLAAENVGSIIRQSIASDMPNLSEHEVFVLQDLLLASIHGITTFSSFGTLRSMHEAKVTETDLTNMAVEAILQWVELTA